MEAEAFVYQWINLTHNKKYIGYHKGNKDDGYVCSSSNVLFWDDFKNPEINWEREILYEGTKEYCLKKEQELLKKIDLRSEDFYNNSRGAEIIFTEGVRKKMSESQKKKWQTLGEEDRKKFSEKQSIAKKGIPRPPEVGNNLSNLLKGKSFVDRFGEEKAKKIGEKISKSNTGKNYHTEEWKKELSKRLKGNDYGKYQSESSREKKRNFFQGENNPGKNKSEETRKKLSNSLKGKKSKLIGIKTKKIKCPHCNKEGGNGVMQRWHFDNCKSRI